MRSGTCRWRFVAHISLCIGEAGPGDQCGRSDRQHKTINHGKFSSGVFIARADNESRCVMFPDAGLCFVNAR
jgi:hypothetical protein